MYIFFGVFVSSKNQNFSHCSDFICYVYIQLNAVRSNNICHSLTARQRICVLCVVALISTFSLKTHTHTQRVFVHTLANTYTHVHKQNGYLLTLKIFQSKIKMCVCVHVFVYNKLKVSIFTNTCKRCTYASMP